ncbi:hypothetical protein N7457_006564 [Penicillium paradoxum]|uniref:uncharacterized protein n=1 Tax=Penicillium paradoxum TaxID=176176 RepID=UPI002548734F|nr:uncharacterized protein N7457_006564 [Penicillium paradoxum]KAJ5778844.1 hypothetical protein N7457_006564 [Penicillium paradoxum]
MLFTQEIVECSPEKLAARQAVNLHLEKATNTQTHWTDAPNIEEYRRWRREGLNGFTKKYEHPRATTIEIPSAHGPHLIPLRIIPPSGEARGLFLHFHGGGFVLGSAASQDDMLGTIADELSLVVASVEYRLAPEHPFPAATHDCLDAALFALSDEGAAKLGGTLRVMGGDSAGGYLTMYTAIQLRNQGIPVREKIVALVSSYGVFDLSMTPSLRSHKRRILLGFDDAAGLLEHYVQTEKAPEDRRDPCLSPLYDDLSNLPPTLFLVGTADLLVDDSTFMASRYALAGNETELKIIPEACHGFTLVPDIEVSVEGNRLILEYIRARLD